MDILSDISTMSIAEMRKFLKDNDINETSQSKEELVNQVGEFILSKMMMNDILSSEKPKDPRTIEREQQDKEYEESLLFDQNGDYIIKQPEQMDQFTEEPIFEELSPRSLREKRMMYYNNTV